MSFSSRFRLIFLMIWHLRPSWELWIRLPFLVVFFIFLLEFLCLGNSSIETFVIGPLLGFFMMLSAIFSFDEEISRDIKDGTFDWLLSQSVSSVSYLWSKILSFSLIVFCLCLIIWASWGPAKAVSLFFLCVQSILLVSYLSFSRHMYDALIGEVTLTLLVFPLCVPSFLIVSEIWYAEAPWWNGFIILGGITLLSFVFGTIAFEKTRTLPA